MTKNGGERMVKKSPRLHIEDGHNIYKELLKFYF